jgi:hypothetical protein
MLGTMGRAIGEEYGGRRRHGVHDADHRLLRHMPRPASGEGENERAQDGRGEPEPVRSRILGVEPH